jgi:hypothetical protein
MVGMSITIEQFADAIGRKKIADANGVGPTAVSNRVVMGLFPASWYFTCSNLAAEAGVSCPPALFAFKNGMGRNPQNMDAPALFQEGKQ